jgi:hypothetical protein
MAAQTLLLAGSVAGWNWPIIRSASSIRWLKLVKLFT